MGTVTRP